MFILFCIRRKNRLRRDGLISIYVDVITILSNGSYLRINHIFEKIFFVALMLITFFVNKIYMDDFLLNTFFPIEGAHIDSFEKIAKFKLPILLDVNISDNNGTMIAMLR